MAKTIYGLSGVCIIMKEASEQVAQVNKHSHKPSLMDYSGATFYGIMIGFPQAAVFPLTCIAYVLAKTM